MCLNHPNGSDSMSTNNLKFSPPLYDFNKSELISKNQMPFSFFLRATFENSKNSSSTYDPRLNMEKNGRKEKILKMSFLNYYFVKILSLVIYF